jgi:hypothetical protein
VPWWFREGILTPVVTFGNDLSPTMFLLIGSKIKLFYGTSANIIKHLKVLRIQMIIFNGAFMI